MPEDDIAAGGMPEEQASSGPAPRASRAPRRRPAGTLAGRWRAGWARCRRDLGPALAGSLGRGAGTVRRGVEAALSLLYPDVCQICSGERATRAEGYVGRNCRREIRFIVPPQCERCGLPFAGDITERFECSNCRELDLQFSRARASVAAQGMVLEVIHRWKYSRALWFEPFLVELLLREALPGLSDEPGDLIVPVPLHRDKETEREFNQAERLAAPLSRASGLPVGRDLLRRVQPTATQTKLSRQQRAANIRGAFAAGPSVGAARGRRVVLVDDVLTTGATASACARVLRAAGALDVCVWTVARGLLH